jgi:GNAT superfamily N-acetyltransferase
MTTLAKTTTGYAIIHEGKEVGLIGIIESEEGLDYIENLWIEEEYRNQGIGTAALGQLKKEYYITPDNEHCTHLYERIGEKISQKEYDAFGFAVDCGFGVYRI